MTMLKLMPMLNQIVHVGLVALLLSGATLHGGDVAELKSGLAVHVCQDSPRPALDLATTGRWIVHSVCPSPESTARVRAAFAEARVYGLASAEYRADLRSLPYARRIVNTLIIDDWNAARQRGLSWDECLRVVVPRGAILVGGVGLDQAKAELATAGLAGQDVTVEGDRVRLTTAWPAELDQWTHSRDRDAGGQSIARDPINPATQNLWCQWLDGEQEPQGCHAAMAAVVSADGRLVSLAGFEVAGLIRDGNYWHGGGRQRWMLSCRDAFNGTVQWLRPWNGTHEKKKKRALAMVAGRIFTIEAGHLTATDLRDGRILYSAAAPVEFHEESCLHCDHEVAAVHDPKGKVLCVFDARTGDLLWRGPPDVTSPVLLDGGRVYVCVAPPAAAAPAPPARLLAMDARTGHVIWSKSAGDFGDENGKMSLAAASSGRVLATVPPGVTAAIDGATGDLLHRFNGVATHILADRVLIPEKVDRGPAAVFYDTATGKRIESGEVPHPYTSLGVYACASGAYTEKMFFDLVGTAGLPKRRDRTLPFPYLGSSGVHATCISGDIVAHGMIYQPQQGCRCGHFRGKLRGLYALAPVDVPPPPKAFEEPGELEQGEAFGKVDAPPPAPSDWPILRANPSRSCATSGPVEPRGILWRKPLAVRPDAWIVRSSWRAQHNHNQIISAPVVANGKVFCSLIDEHQVVAVDEQSGEVVWRYTAAARIDSPPTIHRGLCLFGSRDGWVYCLRAADGRLAWRRHISPSPERILVYGQLESRWPVIGTILVDGDRGYATAGHDAGMNIMVWEFEPATGQTLSYRPTRQAYPNDMLVRGDDGIYLNRAAVAAETPTARPAGWKAALAASQPPTSTHLIALDTPIISSASTLSLGPRGGLYLQQLVATRWTWDATRMIGFTAEGYKKEKDGRQIRPGFSPTTVAKDAVFCLDPAKLDGAANEALRWQTPAEDVWAMALAGPHVILAGPRVERPKPSRRAAQPATAGPRSAPGDSSARQSQTGPLAPGQSADQAWDDAVLSNMIGAWRVRQQDPLKSPGFLHVLDAADGQRLASIDLPSAVVQDGIAVSGQRVYVTTADGSVCCLEESAR
jgi:outer membrane protein assembly factor BamB